jgi:hypothetical protein
VGAVGAARVARVAAIAAIAAGALAAEQAPHPVEQALALAGRTGRARGAGRVVAGRATASAGAAATMTCRATIAAVVLLESGPKAVPPRRLVAAAIAGRAGRGAG